MNDWFYKEEYNENGRVLIATGICTLCGAEFQNGNVGGSKYCENCQKLVQKQKNREYVRAYRERQKLKRLKIV